jgi:hypothetical protein
VTEKLLTAAELAPRRSRRRRLERSLVGLGELHRHAELEGGTCRTKRDDLTGRLVMVGVAAEERYPARRSLAVATALGAPHGGAGAYNSGELLGRSLDPNVEVDALTLDDGLAVADLRPRNDPLIEHHVPLERDFARELDSRFAVREVEEGVVSARHHEGSPRQVRRR